MKYIRFLMYLAVVISFSMASAGSYEDFFFAVKRDDPKAITELLNRGFDAATTDPEGRTGSIASSSRRTATVSPGCGNQCR